LAFATAVAAEAAVAAAQAAAEVVRLTSMPHYTGRTKEEIAAIKVQTAFRGYMVLTSFTFYLNFGVYTKSQMVLYCSSHLQLQPQCRGFWTCCKCIATAIASASAASPRNFP